LKSRSKEIAPAKADVYRQTFITHVHYLLWAGFSRLDRSQLSKLHEPAISGLICQAISLVLDDKASPNWVDDYEIHDDPPVHDRKRQGKHRLRVDIKLASRRSRPRTHFCFEAKSLNGNAGTSDYLGKEGLGQFICGAYSANGRIGGMLAYVQTNDCDHWAAKIAPIIDTDTHQLGRGGKWIRVTVVDALRYTYQTIHKRPGKLGNITVIHTLLDCTG
jgi:hypothetical protein